MVVGLVTLPVSVLTVRLWLFLLGGILAGVGVALRFRSSVATAAGLAEWSNGQGTGRWPRSGVDPLSQREWPGHSGRATLPTI
jgi:hypothetical protein